MKLSPTSGSENILWNCHGKYWRFYIQNFPAHAPYGTQFFFSHHFHQKAPTSEVHVPPNGSTAPQREILDPPVEREKQNDYSVYTISLNYAHTLCGSTKSLRNEKRPVSLKRLTPKLMEVYPFIHRRYLRFKILNIL